MTKFGHLPTIIILAHKRVDHLVQVVESLAGARGIEHHRVVGIVDGNWPASMDIIRSTLSPEVLVEMTHEDGLQPRNRISKNLQVGLRLGFEYFSAPYCVVLEDDIVVSSDFLDFVSSVYLSHRRQPSFRAINGFSRLPPHPRHRASDYVRLNYGAGWGWALPKKSYGQVKKLLERSGDHHWDGLIEPYLRTGYVVNPLRSRVVNIGFDGTGAHTGTALHQQIGREMKTSLVGPDEWSSTPANIREAAVPFLWREDAIAIGSLNVFYRGMAFGAGRMLMMISAVIFQFSNSRWAVAIGPIRKLKRALVSGTLPFLASRAARKSSKLARLKPFKLGRLG